MTRHLGPSIFFSVAIVAFFAVTLSPPEIKRRPELAAGTSVPIARPEPATSRPRPEPTPGAPFSENSVPAEPPQSKSPKAHDPSFSVLPDLPPPVSRKRPRAEARSAFTEVVEGETLADVAVRVYGSADAARALWTANRDAVEHPAAPLDGGMILRTP